MGRAEMPSELTARIGRVALRVFTERGILTYEELSHHRQTDLLGIHGIGPKSIRILTEELAERGLMFAQGDPE